MLTTIFKYTCKIFMTTLMVNSVREDLVCPEKDLLSNFAQADIDPPSTFSQWHITFYHILSHISHTFPCIDTHSKSLHVSSTITFKRISTNHSPPKPTTGAKILARWWLPTITHNMSQFFVILTHLYCIHLDENLIAIRKQYYLQLHPE